MVSPQCESLNERLSFPSLKNSLSIVYIKMGFHPNDDFEDGGLVKLLWQKFLSMIQLDRYAIYDSNLSSLLNFFHLYISFYFCF